MAGLLTLYYSFNQNLRFPVHHYNSEIWADKAGYYVYLPATFIYNWDANAFPARADTLSGEGFKLNSNGTVFTKYPPGVAMMELPVFLAVHSYMKWFQPGRADGFQQPYETGLIVSAELAWFMGLYLLGLLALKHGWSTRRTVGLLLAVLVATHTAYFAIWQPAMSHGYTFLLVAWLLWLHHKEVNVRNALVTAGIVALIGCIRPVNLLVISPLLWVIVKRQWQTITEWKWRGIQAVCLMLGLLPLILHSLYNRHAGEVAYAGEGFTHWKAPWIHAILFSASNGVAVYTPFLFFLIAWVFRSAVYASSGWSPSRIAALCVLITLFLYGSWWIPTLSCGLSHRAFLDILPLIFWAGMQADWEKLWRGKPVWIFALICGIYTSYLAVQYPSCLNDAKGTNPWIWSEYFGLWRTS
ncbi:MAG: hypothetical protein JNL57_05490 [Bacteroidetes bacterium]|nr:hypothetical protein [Bacteroidota bacterium]